MLMFFPSHKLRCWSRLQ